MAGANAWRVRWRYADVSGNLLKQYPEQEADFIVTPLTGGDGAVRPDPADAMDRIANSFATPPGASIVLLGISSSQTSVIYL